MEKRFPHYRLYLDETGDHADPTTDDVGIRYLGLTGIIIRRDLNRAVADDFDQLKRKHFNVDPDEGPLCLHRKELLHATGRFLRLSDSRRREAFDEDLFALLERTDYPQRSLKT